MLQRFLPLREICHGNKTHRLEEYISFVKWKSIIVKGEKEKVNSYDAGRAVFKIIMYGS